MVVDKKGYPKSWRQGWLECSGGAIYAIVFSADFQICTLLIDYILEDSGSTNGGMG
jgi:hypothetical protein